VLWIGNWFPRLNTSATAERTKLMSRRVEQEIEDQGQDSKLRQQIHPGSKTKIGAKKKKIAHQAATGE
jgi:hypothetical protein